MAGPEKVRSCYVCTYAICAKWGGEELLAGLKERLAESDVRVKSYSCFGQCWMGPNIVLDPPGTWLAEVEPEDLDDVVAHVQGGPPIERRIHEVDEDILRSALWMPPDDVT